MRSGSERPETAQQATGKRETGNGKRESTDAAQSRSIPSDRVRSRLMISDSRFPFPVACWAVPRSPPSNRSDDLLTPPVDPLHEHGPRLPSIPRILDLEPIRRLIQKLVAVPAPPPRAGVALERQGVPLPLAARWGGRGLPHRVDPVPDVALLAVVPAEDAVAAVAGAPIFFLDVVLDDEEAVD